MSKNLKIALLTYHYGYNEGTLLQAYATARLLRKKLPSCIVDVIDARHPQKEKIAFNKPRNSREKSLRKFFECHLENKKKLIRSTTPKRVFKKISLEYDLVVVGSDEVWRLDYNVKSILGFEWHRQTNPWAPPFPNFYWPNAREMRVPCVTFASSISEMNDLNLVPERHKKKIRDILSEFSLVAVRDTRSHDFIESVIEGFDSHWLPDPTFSLPNATDEEIASLSLKLNLNQQRKNSKIALVNCHVPVPALNHTINFCKQKGYFIVGMSHHVNGADINLSDIALDPLEWATLPALANLLITDRFHGAVFALKNNTPVVALDHRGQISGSKSKINDLFTRFGILDFWFPLKDGMIENMKDLESRLEKIDSMWPTQSVHDTCVNFRKNLEDFIDGPVNQLVADIVRKSEA